MEAHYKILKSLYEILNATSDNNVYEKVARIAWSLEFDLNNDSFGYHELSELATNYQKGLTDDSSNNHYIEVIETKLESLSS